MVNLTFPTYHEAEAAFLEEPDTNAFEVSAPRENGKRRVLLVEDDPSTAETLGWMLRALQVEVRWAPRGADALTVTRRMHFDLVLIDLTLPDISGMDVMRSLRAQDVRAPFIVVSGYVTVPLAVDAMKLGAHSVLEKPFDDTELITVVASALGIDHSPDSAQSPRRDITARLLPNPSEAPGSVTERWAHLVLNTIRAQQDPKTINEWARYLGLSRSALCERCRLVKISPHDARDFARVMRAVCRSGHRWQPESMLDVADSRTLRKLLARAGLKDRAAAVAPTTEEFLRTQQWIPEHNPGLVTLRQLLAGR